MPGAEYQGNDPYGFDDSVDLTSSLSSEIIPKAERRIIVSIRRGVKGEGCEVRPLHSSVEAGEQTWATGGGAGGAEEEDQGEHGRATHVPDTAPGKRVPEA